MPPADDSSPPPTAWIELPDKNTVTLNGDCHIGRTEGNEIVNPDNRISRRHAVIQRQGERFVLVDLGSTNGTFLNESRIFTARKLRHGDVILVGSLRYIFHQPSLTAVSLAGDSAQHTVVSVGKTTCWMLLAASSALPSAPAVAWAEQIRQSVAASGAGVRNVRNGVIFAYWRDNAITAEKMRALLEELARLPRPAEAHVAIHHGAVRVGLAATTGENLLGAEVNLTHKLETTAAGLGVSFLLSEAAAQALGPTSFVSPLGERAIHDTPGVHPLFTLAPG